MLKADDEEVHPAWKLKPPSIGPFRGGIAQLIGDRFRHQFGGGVKIVQRSSGNGGNRVSGRLHAYGDMLFTCLGTGRLFDSEENPWDCKFEVGQLENGDCLALCDLEGALPTISLLSASPERLVGETEDGRTLVATGLFSGNYLPETPEGQSGVFFAFFVDRLDFSTNTKNPEHFVIFGLTNLILRAQTISVSSLVGDMRIYPISGSPVREQRLQALKGVQVTAELELAWSADEAGLGQVVDDVCYLLSIARGTKIQWVYRVDLDADGAIVRSSRLSHVTKKYTPLCIIDYRQPRHTENFLNTCLTTYRSLREQWALNSGLVDAYLDAKAESDFLPLRGVKLAVAVEMLKAQFIRAREYPEFIIDPEQFDGIIPRLKKALKPVLSPLFNKDQRGCLYGHLSALNRSQFRDVLDALCKFLSIDVSKDDLDLFVECRNHLVHDGRFLFDLEPQAASRFENSYQEYSWLVNFVDRLFLRLVGYRGPYLDHSGSGTPVLREDL